MDDDDAGGDNGSLLAWCVVANVAAETTHGPGRQEIRRGLKHFSGGAKVWVLPPQWGDAGDSVFVIGRHRGASRRGYIRMVIPRRHLTNFRVRGIYSPAVIREITKPWRHMSEGPRLWASQEDAQQAADLWGVLAKGITALDTLATATSADLPLSPGLAETIHWVVEVTRHETLPNIGLLIFTLRDLYLHEIAMIQTVRGKLLGVLDDVGPSRPDQEYLTHPSWPEVAVAVGALRDLLARQPDAGGVD